MDNPNITIEEYIKLDEEKSRQRGKVYNWELLSMLRSSKMKTFKTSDPFNELLAIVFNDELSSEKTLSCEPTVSSLNDNEIDFGISFDESDDEDYMVYNWELLSMLRSSKMKTFKTSDPFNELLAIVFNDELSSEKTLSCEPTPLFTEFDLKSETSLSECDEEE
nr:hypothetical protein [Tanacetum cinerariifolium]